MFETDYRKKARDRVRLDIRNAPLFKLPNDVVHVDLCTSSRLAKNEDFWT